MTAKYIFMLKISDKIYNFPEIYILCHERASMPPAENFPEAARICLLLNTTEMELPCEHLLLLRDSCPFMPCVSDNATNCSHAVNDARKQCGIETYALTGNVCELIVRTNDDGRSDVFAAWQANQTTN